MVAVSTTDEEIKICDSGSRSVDCSCETFIFLILRLDFFFVSMCTVVLLLI